MNVEIKDFIGVFGNVASKEYCQKVIEQFELRQKLNQVKNRQNHDNVIKTVKDNNFYFPIDEITNESIAFESDEYILKEFNTIAANCYNLYNERYGVLQNVENHKMAQSIKIQKTLPSEGYHVWHCEHADLLSSRRLLLVMLYLNDISEGGETEFLYQSLRLRPREGTLVIVPSSFTHTHRGNPPLSGTKYMINGWIEFTK